MAPPHNDNSKKAKKMKTSAESPSEQQSQRSAQVKGNNKRNKKKQHANPDNCSKAGSTNDHSDPNAKVSKKKRQRGGRSLARGRAAKKDESSSNSSWAKRALHQQTGHHHLLTLPAEIRFTIFEMVLKEPRTILVSTSMKWPGIFQVCRQLRSEATRVWLKANKFNIIVDRMSPQMPVFWKFLELTHSCTTKAKMTIMPSHNWTNLTSWAMMVHSQQAVRVPGWKEGMTEGYAVAYTVMGIALAMIGKPWLECQVALEKLRSTLEVFDEGWR